MAWKLFAFLGLTYVDKNTVQPVSNLQTNDSQEPVLLMTQSKWFI